jgi:hypothetical protein
MLLQRTPHMKGHCYRARQKSRVRAKTTCVCTRGLALLQQHARHCAHHHGDGPTHPAIFPSMACLRARGGAWRLLLLVKATLMLRGDTDTHTCVLRACGFCLLGGLSAFRHTMGDSETISADLQVSLTPVSQERALWSPASACCITSGPSEVPTAATPADQPLLP